MGRSGSASDVPDVEPRFRSEFPADVKRDARRRGARYSPAPRGDLTRAAG